MHKFNKIISIFIIVYISISTIINIVLATYIIIRSSNDNYIYIPPITDDQPIKEYISLIKVSDQNSLLFNYNNYYIASISNENIDSNIVPIDNITINNRNVDDIVFFVNDDNTLFVNDEYFESLVYNNAVYKKNNEFVFVGKYSPYWMAFNNYDRLAEFLIKSEIIKTYSHSNSEVYLVDVVKNDKDVEYKYIADHYYYTNQANVDRYSFSIIIDTDSKTIFIR
jgi:hypothetical protein